MEKRIYFEMDGDRSFIQKDPSFTKLVKTARLQDVSGEIKEFLRENKPKEGYGFLLIAAMGDDNWGDNRNKDLFPEEGLSNDGEEWGYKTYMNGGKWFRKHRNKETDESYGDVVFSYFNTKMHRVEVITEYNISKDDWTASSLENDEDIQTSMGTTINYDICSACHPDWRKFYKVPESEMKVLADTKSDEVVKEISDKYNLELPSPYKFNSGGGLLGIAKDGTRYCDHINFRLGEYLPTGNKIVMVNLRPKLFDISFVNTNADKSSFVLAKVAEDKQSDDKKSEMTKEVPSEIISKEQDEILNYFNEVISPSLRSGEEEIPNKVLDTMASKHSLEEILSSFLAIGSLPKNKEMQRIIIINMGKSPGYADDLERKGHIINDQMISDMRGLAGGMELDLGYNHVNDDILQSIMPFAMNKSYYNRPVCKRIIMIKKAKDINAYIPAEYNSFSKGPIPQILFTIAAFAGIAKLSGNKSMLKVLHGMLKNRTSTVGAILGASAAAEILSNINREVQNNKEFLNQKVSALGMKSLIGIPAGSYVWGEHIKNKARRGRQISLPEEAIAKYPLGSSIAMLLAASAISKSSAGQMAKGLFKKVGEDMAVSIGFEGLDINDYPISKQAEVIVGFFDAIGTKYMHLIKNA